LEVVKTPADWNSCKMAIEQRSSTTVLDNGNVRLASLRHNLLDRPNDPCLGVGCSLPASHTRVRLRKKGVDRCFVLFLREKAGRGSVVLAEVRDGAVPV
jgi:hypothetical protein